MGMTTADSLSCGRHWFIHRMVGRGVGRGKERGWRRNRGTARAKIKSLADSKPQTEAQESRQLLWAIEQSERVQKKERNWELTPQLKRMQAGMCPYARRRPQRFRARRSVRRLRRVRRKEHSLSRRVQNHGG